MTVTTHSNQYATSVYYKAPLEASSGNTISSLVMIPGNPGLVQFYKTYLNIIQERYPQFEIFCVSHAGYQTSKPKLDGKFHFYDLSYQVDHKYEIIKQHILEKTTKGKVLELYFLSHSVGSYISQRLFMRLLEDEELKGKFTIKFTGLICPTIRDIRDSESGVIFTNLFKYLPVVHLFIILASILRFFMSESMARSIIGKYFVDKPTIEDEKSLDSFKDSVEGCYHLYESNLLIKQTVTLARQELEEIRSNDDVNDWFYRGPLAQSCKIWTFFATSDYWVNNVTRDYLLERYHDTESRNVVFHVDPTNAGITHSFCVHQSVEFATLTVNLLQELFPEGI